jgi:hypothetical protein
MYGLKETFGYDGRKLWWYRDLALGTIATIAALWSFAELLFVPYSPIDFRIGLICMLIAVACCVISPNRLVLFILVVAAVAVRGWFVVARFPTEILSWAVAVPATILALVLFRAFGNRPARQR